MPQLPLSKPKIPSSPLSSPSSCPSGVSLENPYSSRCEASALKFRAAQQQFQGCTLGIGSPPGVPGKRTSSPSVPSPSQSIGPPVPAPDAPPPASAAQEWRQHAGPAWGLNAH